MNDNDYIECRLFKSTVFWADVLFYFPNDISFDEIKSNINSSFLTKNDYIGKFKFHYIFLSNIDTMKINKKPFYFTYYIPNGF